MRSRNTPFSWPFGAILLAATVPAWGGSANAPKAKPEETPAQAAPAASERTQLNLLGQTDSSSGESRRNENVQFNLIDNNALKELNQRIGTTVTFVNEFLPDRGYFGAEYGSAPPGPILLKPLLPGAWHANFNWNHQNSVTAARSFFQVGGVRPSHENQSSFQAGGRVWRGANLSLTGSLQRTYGMVNGNIIAPLPSERSVLATEPKLRAYVQRLMDAYPDIAPNRPDIDSRMINLNSPQRIANNSMTSRLDQSLSAKDSLALSHTYLIQQVKAFQLVQGQNPDTTTRSHNAAVTWNRAWSAATVSQLGVRFDRAGSVLLPEPNNPGPGLFVSNILTVVNPSNSIPIDRAYNQFRTAGQLRRSQGKHLLTAGFEINRKQLNGRETDSHLGNITFSNNFGADAITNFRPGRATAYYVSVGDVTRGFRYWDNWFYVGDRYAIRSNLTLSLSAGYRPITKPFEVNGRNQLPYYSDWKNFGPSAGLAWRPGRGLGVVRTGFGMHYGEIFPVTFQQVRFNAPGNVKIIIQDPDLTNPLKDLRLGSGSLPRSVLYGFQDNLVSPYGMQYNFTWELEPRKGWRVQTGYVGSRASQLLHHWYENRARPVPGIPLTTSTIDLRRADPRYSEIRRVTNGSRAYFDAFKTTLLLPSFRGLNLDTSFWFSKSLDLGADYTNVAQDNDSFKSRSQSEFNVHRDMKGRSRFDQPHAFLLRASYALPALAALPGRARHWAGKWTVTSVVLAKSGTPFNLSTGSDAPGFGNGDGVNGDRPNILDPTILGRAITHPDLSHQQLPRAAFSFIVPGQLEGNTGRNVFRRAPLRNWNAGLSGGWTLPHEVRLGLRAEAINLTNTPQFAEPGYSLTDSNFGAITNTLNDGRAFRFQLSLGF